MGSSHVRTNVIDVDVGGEAQFALVQNWCECISRRMDELLMLAKAFLCEIKEVTTMDYGIRRIKDEISLC